MPQKDPTYSNPNATIGESDHPQHRAGPGEGVRAPLAAEGAEHPEISIFDGAGNESVAVLGQDEQGRPKQGTGPTSAAAMTDARQSGDPLGDDFSPGKH